MVDGDLYISTPLPMGTDEPKKRRWVRNVLRDPRVRVRIESSIYPARLERVRDTALRERVMATFTEKYDLADPSRTLHAWLFRLRDNG